MTRVTIRRRVRRIAAISCFVGLCLTGLPLVAQDASEAGTEKGESQAENVEAATKVLDASSEDEEGLEIRGQTRTLSMMLVLQNRRDKIDFIKPRTDYRDWILSTEY